MSTVSQGPALVTGASSGLGVELARACARRGRDVLLVARRADRLEALAAELAADHGVRAESLACDLADPEARDALADRAAEAGWEVDLLVNNAGLAASGRFQEVDPGKVRGILAVNAQAVAGLTADFLPGMVARGRGGVLNVGSTTGFQPLAGNGTYAATKAFVLAFTEALHHDLRGTGVRATVVCPGPVKTELWEQAGATEVADRTPGIFWTDADWVAEQALKGLEAGKRVVVPGLANRIGTLSGQHAPRSVVLRLSKIVGG